MFNEELWDNVVNGSPALRVALLEDEPKYFAMYYFSEYFTYATPQFHEDMFQDCIDLTTAEIMEVMWCMHREGAKTSIGKIALVIWWICYRKKKYINWDAFDSSNSEAALFDVTVALQTNKKLISDFGNLYYKKKENTALVEAKMKRVRDFITENDVKVSAFSTQESTRGRLYKNQRPDAYVFDDFETVKTKDSGLITNKVIEHIEEARAGASVDTSFVYLCNFLTDSGSVAHFMEALKRSTKGRVRFVPVMDSKGVIAWPDKFVHTDKEAQETNRNILDPKQKKISIEERRNTLGESVFQTEFMLNPASSGDLFFDRAKVLKAIEKAVPPIESIAGLKVWFKFNPRHRYGMGADTAEGLGNDSNASAIIDFTPKPAQLVASFEDNQMTSAVLGWELKRQGAYYNYPYLVPEINNTGYATISELQNAQYPNIYQREATNKVTNKVQKEYGWKATVGTKHEVMSAFKIAFEDGDLEILDAGLLGEMKFYTKLDNRITNRQKGATRHYDKLRAAALAWYAQAFAPEPTAEREKKFFNVQAPYQQ